MQNQNQIMKSETALVLRNLRKLLTLPPSKGISFCEIIPKNKLSLNVKKEIKATLFQNFNVYNKSENEQKMYSLKIERLFDFLEEENIPGEFVIEGIKRFLKSYRYPNWTIGEVYSHIEPDLSKLFTYSKVLEMHNDDRYIYSKVDSYWINYNDKDEKPIVLYKMIDAVDLTKYGFIKIWDGKLGKNANDLPYSIAKSEPQSEPTSEAKANKPFSDAGRLFKLEVDIDDLKSEIETMKKQINSIQKEK